MSDAWMLDTIKRLTAEEQDLERRLAAVRAARQALAMSGLEVAPTPPADGNAYIRRVHAAILNTSPGVVFSRRTVMECVPGGTNLNNVGVVLIRLCQRGILDRVAPGRYVLRNHPGAGPANGASPPVTP